jgi:Zn-dependent protease with chaperone function
MSHKRLIDWLSIIISGFIWILIPSDMAASLTQLLSDRIFNICFLLPYSRFIETEADELGIQLTARVRPKK